MVARKIYGPLNPIWSKVRTVPLVVRTYPMYRAVSGHQLDLPSTLIVLPRTNKSNWKSIPNSRIEWSPQSGHKSLSIARLVARGSKHFTIPVPAYRHIAYTKTSDTGYRVIPDRGILGWRGYNTHDDDDSYSIRHWTDVPPGEVCFRPSSRGRLRSGP